MMTIKKQRWKEAQRRLVKRFSKFIYIYLCLFFLCINFTLVFKYLLNNNLVIIRNKRCGTISISSDFVNSNIKSINWFRCYIFMSLKVSKNIYYYIIILNLKIQVVSFTHLIFLITLPSKRWV